MKHSVVANEPIKELLGNIESGLTKKLLATFYDDDESAVPTIDYIGGTTPLSPSIIKKHGIEVATDEEITEYKFGTSLPLLNCWLECLAGPSFGWKRALLTSQTIVQGNGYVDNPIRRLFAPRAGQKVVVVDSDSPSITLYGAGRSFGPHPEDFKAVEAQFDSSNGHISLTVFEERGGVSVPLSLKFHYRPDQGFAPIHEVVEDRNTRIKDFYWRLWFGDDREMPTLKSRQTFEGPETRVEASEIERFCAVVKNDGEAFKTVRSDAVQAPLDFAIVTGWQVSNLSCIVS